MSDGTRSDQWQANTIAALRSARQTNKRLGSRKSRSGCSTCKLRRVKCGEEKPNCERCVRSGRRCDGYESPQSIATTAISRAPSALQTLSSLGEQDRLTFDYFRSHCAPRIAGVLDTNFWCDKIFQLSHSEPFVLDAVLALSTLYRYPQYLRSFSNGLPHDAPRSDKIHLLATGAPFGNLKLDKHHATALGHYNRSISRVKQRLEEEPGSQWIALLSCLLFFTIETIRDNVFEAMELLYKSASLRGIDDRHSKNPLVQDVDSAFDRFHFVVASPSPTPACNPPLQILEFRQSRSFASLYDARSALYSLIMEGKAFARQAAHYRMLTTHGSEIASEVEAATEDFVYSPDSWISKTKSEKSQAGSQPRDCPKAPSKVLSVGPLDYGWTSMTPSDPVVAPAPETSLFDLVGVECRLASSLRQWHYAFADCASSAEVQIQPEAVSLLLMYYHVSVIWLSTRLVSAETVFDQFVHEFRQVLHHAEIHIQARAAENRHFTFDLGAIPPLYFVATKCRVPSLRRKALLLLTKAPKKESSWGANPTAEIAAAIIAIEEQRLGLCPPHAVSNVLSQGMDDTVPPEEDRVHYLQMLKDEETLSFSLLLTKYVTASDSTRLAEEVEVPLRPLSVEDGT